MSRWAWLASFAIGCGHASAPAAPATSPNQSAADAAVGLENDLPRMAARMAQMYRDWKQAFADAGTDCTAATAKMNALVDANRDLSEASRRLLRAGHDKVKAFRTEREKYDAEIDANAKAIFESPTIAACKNDKAFARAFDRLGGDG
jgi:hypothetical protein